FRNAVSRGVDVFIAEDERGALGRPIDQPHLGGKNHDAGAFSPDQRARHVEAAFGQELIERVAGAAARDIGIAAGDESGALVAQRAQAGVDFGARAAFTQDALEIFIGGGANAQAKAVIGQDVEFENVVHGASGHHGVDAAGVVADHTAKV